MLKTRFSHFVFLGHGRSFWPILTIVILAFVNLDCFLVHLFFVFLVFFFFEKVYLLFCELSIKIGNHFSILVLCFEPRKSSSFGLILSEEILLGRFLCASDPCSHTSAP